MEWERFHLPPIVGGLRDQPIRLMKEIRLAVGTYHSINTWKRAEQSLNSEGFARFTAQNPELVKFMSELWQAQFAAQEESQ